MTERERNRRRRMDKGADRAKKPRRQQRIEEMRRGDVIEMGEPAAPYAPRLPN